MISIFVFRLASLYHLNCIHYVIFLKRNFHCSTLHISEPWFISSVNFNPEHKRLDVEVDFERGSKFTISGGFGTYTGKAYDTRQKSWRHLNFFEHECYINARVPRIKEPTGKIRMVNTPWEGKMNGFTLLFEALLLQLFSCMPVLKVQNITGINDDKLWDLLHCYIDEAVSNMDLSELDQVGLDETSRAKCHEYISLFVDMYKRKIIYITQGKDSAVLKEFANFIREHSADQEQITDLSMDMSKAFIKDANDQFPQASKIGSGLNNGILEGLYSMIQAAKAKARGYKLPKNLMAIAYLIAGDLDLENLNEHYSKA